MEVFMVLWLKTEQPESKNKIPWINRSKQNNYKKSRVYPKSTNQICLTLYSIYIFYFLQDKKGSKDMYKTLGKSKLTNVIAISKWSNYGVNFSKNSLEKYFYFPFRTTTKTKLHYLQLQIIHSIIPCYNFFFI